MASQAVESVARSYAPVEFSQRLPTSNVTGQAEAIETLGRDLANKIFKRDFEHIIIAADDVIKYAESIKAWAADRAPGGKFGEPKTLVEVFAEPGVLGRRESSQVAMYIDVLFGNPDIGAASAVSDLQKAWADKDAVRTKRYLGIVAENAQAAHNVLERAGVR